MYLGNNKLTQIATEIYFKRQHKSAAPMFSLPDEFKVKNNVLIVLWLDYFCSLKNKKNNFFLWKNI